MKARKKRSSQKNRGQRTSPGLSPRNWRFWVLAVATAGWFTLFGFAMTGALKKPSMTKWWADQVKAEDKTLVPQGPLSTVKKDDTPVPYPKDGDYYQLNFDILSSFPADTPPLNNPRQDPRIKRKPPAAQVPPAIQALDGKRISVAGFMIPMNTDKDRVLSFILAQTRGSCCYGLVPKLNQWIYVEMSGTTVDNVMDVPITVFGTLSIHNLNTQNKDWCLYRMSGDKVDLPKRTWF